MSDFSRRSVLAGIPAVAAANIPVAADAAPILAAIAAHRAAWALFSATYDPSDNVYAEQTGTVYTDADHEAFDAANDAEEAAWGALIEHPCKTFADVQTKASYLLTCGRNLGLSWQEEHVGALLTSLLGGAHV